jgi:hypothetical protein
MEHPPGVEHRTPDGNRAAPSPGGPAAAAVAWGRVAVVGLLLVAAGATRYWQAGRVGARLEQGRQAPFPLAGLPLALGDWKGIPTTLDPQLVRATGCTDHVVRHYVDERTGVGVDVIVLYGPAPELFNHTPDVCYPAAGHRLVDGPSLRTVRLGRRPVPLRHLIFAKGDGARALRQQVYYTWRVAGRWSLEHGDYKQFERIPDVYKVHLARRVAARERLDVGNPCEAFLQVLLPALEHRLSGAGGPGPSSSS